MTEPILHALEQAMASPWVYAAIFALAALDAFFPVVPAETSVITAGVFAAATGEPHIVAVIGVAALGALAGDHISYTLGRLAGRPLLHRASPGSRKRTAFDWAQRVLYERGGLILVVARYIPGGRTAITLTMGAVHYPLRMFSFFDVIAASSWGVYSGLIGYLGGAAFEESPLTGLLLGLAIAISVTTVVEVIRYVGHRSRRRRRGVRPAAGEDPDDPANVGNPGNPSGRTRTDRPDPDNRDNSSNRADSDPDHAPAAVGTPD